MNTMMLKDVFIRDCELISQEDDVLEDTNLEKLTQFDMLDDHLSAYNPDDQCTTVVEKETEIPSTFVSFDLWIKMTALRCWECCLRFEGIPWFIPTGMIKHTVRSKDLRGDEKTSEQDAYAIFGVFCTPFCAQRYLRYSGDQRITNVWQCEKLLLNVYCSYIGKNRVQIPISEHRSIMEEYCGPAGGISTDEYRKRLFKLWMS